MATPSVKGKYIKVEVQIWYDPRSDNIHITSNDKDFGLNGFHMTAKKGTQSDTNARIALEKYGYQANKLTKSVKVAKLVDTIKTLELTPKEKEVLYKSLL